MTDLIKAGRYQSKSEILRDGLRIIEEREQKLQNLRAAIQEGIDSGPDIPAEEVFAELKERYSNDKN